MMQWRVLSPAVLISYFLNRTVNGTLLYTLLHSSSIFCINTKDSPPYQILITWFPTIRLCYEALMAKTDEQKSAQPLFVFISNLRHIVLVRVSAVSLGMGWAFKRPFPAIVASEIPPTDGELWKNGLHIVSAGNVCLLGGLTNDSIVVLLYWGRIVWFSTTCSFIYLFFLKHSFLYFASFPFCGPGVFSWNVFFSSPSVSVRQNGHLSSKWSWRSPVTKEKISC